MNSVHIFWSMVIEFSGQFQIYQSRHKTECKRMKNLALKVKTIPSFFSKVFFSRPLPNSKTQGRLLLLLCCCQGDLGGCQVVVRVFWVIVSASMLSLRCFEWLPVPIGFLLEPFEPTQWMRILHKTVNQNSIFH